MPRRTSPLFSKQKMDEIILQRHLICRAIGVTRCSKSPYQNGYVRCRPCNAWYNDTVGNRCPCCHLMLRHHPMDKTSVEHARL